MLVLHPQSRPIVPVVVFLLSAIAAATVLWYSAQHDREEERLRVHNLAGEHASNLQRSMERGLSATYALAALVRQGAGEVPNFDQVASQMLPFYPGVSELALAPGGVIRKVAPLTGNEKAIGLDLLRDPAQRKEAYLARDTGRLTLAGPLDLVQGGVGAVGRLPVFLDDRAGKPYFWGFTLVVIRFPEALNAVDLPQLAQRGFAYELWRTHPGTGQKQVIAASSKAVPGEAVTRTLQVPNATWSLSVAPVAGWGDPAQRTVEAALGLAFSLLLAYLAKLLLDLRVHREGLEALVGERTAQVRAREADLNYAQSIARVGSWVLDLDTKELRGSAEAARIFGASGSGPIGYKSVLKQVHPDDRAAVDRASRASLKGAPYDIEYRILAGGAVRWVHSNAELSFDADGKLSRALGTIQDITERKRAEEALRQGEARYRELFEGNPQPMWVYDLDSLKFLAVNDAAVAHYGYSRDEFAAMSILDIRPPEEVARLMQRLTTVRQEDVRDAGLWRQRKKDGTLIDVEVTAHTLDFSGRRAQIVHISDVTERLRVERELRASEERYRALTDLSSDWYWEQDEDLRFTRMSKPNAGQDEIELDTFLGRTRREAPGIVWDEPQLAALEAICEARRAFRDFEIGRVYRDGPKRYVQMSGEPIFDASGRFAGYRGIGKDITERKEREQDLLRFRAAMNATEDAIYLVDRDSMRFIDINSGACNMLGMTREEILAAGPEGVLGMTREELARIYAAVIAGGGAMQPVEMLRQRKDGRRAWIEIRRHAKKSETSWTIVTVARDITQRKLAETALLESEARFRTLIEWTPEPLAVHRDGKLLYVNPAAIRLFGANSKEELIGKSVLDLIHPDYRASWLARLKDIVELGADLPMMARRLLRLDGTVFEAETKGTSITYEGAPAVHLAIRDVTELKRREDELRRLNQELEDRVTERTHALEVANNELEAFSYSVSHDLRAPLRAIHGFSSLVQQQYAGRIDDQGRDMLRRVGAGAEKMGHLIDDLLNLSRVSRQVMRIEPVDLSELAWEVVGELQMAAPERKVEWVIAPRVLAAGDTGLLRVVMQNLLDNAWKYSSRREAARIEFGVGESEGRPEYFVRDNGAGFDMTYASKLFGAFQRLHAASEFPGTGIGLATVARILHRHGGKARAEARMGEGATFYFSLS